MLVSDYILFPNSCLKTAQCNANYVKNLYLNPVFWKLTVLPKAIMLGLHKDCKRLQISYG